MLPRLLSRLCVDPHSLHERWQNTFHFRPGSAQPGRFFLALFLLAGLFLFTAGSGRADRSELQGPAALETPAAARVVRIFYQSPLRLAELAAALDIWEVDPAARTLLAQVRADQFTSLQQAGYRMEIDATRTAWLTAARRPLAGQSSGIPGYPCYRTVEETYTALQALVTARPDLAALTILGPSWKKQSGSGGYDILELTLTNQAHPGPRPRLFLMAAIHAREYVTAETALRFSEWLVDRYGHDPDVTALLDFYEVHIVTTANPDGRKLAEAGRLWRKNTNSSDGCNTSFYWGVDLNRNSSFHWGGAGASTYACDETYRGRLAASEPETQAIQNAVLNLFPDQREADIDDAAPLDASGLLITLHSYGNLVLWPWGDVYAAAPNAAQLRRLGRKLAYFNHYTASQAVELYPVSGATDDWAYGTLGLAAYTVEMGYTFFESCALFESEIYPQNRDMLLYAFKAVRRPYLEPAGPEALDLSVSNSTVFAGQPLTLTAVIESGRFVPIALDPEPVYQIASARSSLDAPAWFTGTRSSAMEALDGVWDSSREFVRVRIDTTGLLSGRHSLFIEGQDEAGQRGVFSSAFFTVTAAVYDFSVEPSVSLKGGDPGSVVTHTAWVRNLGMLADVYTVSAAAGAWPLQVPTQLGPLLPGAVQAFPLTATIPMTATPGQASVWHLQLTSQGDPGLQVGLGVTTVVPVYGLRLAPHSAFQTQAPGRVAGYLLQVYNAGNLNDRADVTVVKNNWPVQVPAELALAPGMTATLPVSVTVPITAAYDRTDILVMRLASHADPLQGVTASLTTRVGEVFGVSLWPSVQNGSAPAGGQHTYTFGIRNLGSLTDTFTAILSGTWPAQAAPLPALSADQVISWPVTVSVPMTAPLGASDLLQISLTSSQDPRRTARAALHTRVLSYPVYLVRVAWRQP